MRAARERLERERDAHARAAATHDRAARLHEQAAEQALQADDLVREARERNMVAEQNEAAGRERRREARAVEALAALDA